MEIISQFEKNSTTFVEDAEGNTYELKLVKCANFSITDVSLKNKIIDMLEKLKVPTYKSGYNFLIDCLYFSIKSKHYQENLSTNLYPIVAQIHNVKISTIPGALDSLICYWIRTNEYKEIFGCKCVGAKKLILGLTDYFFKQN